MSWNKNCRDSLKTTHDMTQKCHRNIEQLESIFRDSLPDDLKADYDLIQQTKNLLSVIEKVDNG